MRAFYPLLSSPPGLLDAFDLLRRDRRDALGGADAAPLAFHLADRPGQFDLTLEAPGLKAEGLTLEAKGRQVQVSYVPDAPAERKGFLCARAWQQVFTLPRALASEGHQARLENGLLTLSLRKAETERGPVRIPLTVSALEAPTSGEETSA